MKKEISFVIIGCGMIASYHADAIRGIDGARLVGAYDANRQARETFCEKYQIKVYENREELLEAQEIDAVCICLPSGLHYEVALMCAAYKKHVVVEKPMALSVKQCDEIISAAEENDVLVTVISQLRYTESVNALKNAVENHQLGRVTLADISMKYYRDKEYYSQSSWRGTLKMDGGGALMNQGIHGIDLLQYVMGKVISVQAASRTLLHHIETEDTLVALLEYEDGSIGTVQATTSVYPGFQRKLSISGTEGTIVLSEDAIEVWELQNHVARSPTPEMETQLKTGSRPDGMDCSLHQRQLEDFVYCIQHKKQPFIDAKEGRKAVAIICAIYEAAKTGKKIYLEN